VKDLGKFFQPKSIAIVGVSSKTTGLGGMSYLVRYLDAGFPGRIYPVNPRGGEIVGLKTYASLSSLPEVPDLTTICVPAGSVPGVLEECGRLGARHIHLLTSGFGEIGTEEGRKLDGRIAAAAREHRLLIMGPNGMGPYCPSARLTAWGAIPGRDGPVGIVSQSGGITQRLTEWLCSLGVGVSKAASIGNATVLDVNDCLEFLAADPSTRVIGIYLESVREGRRLLDLARQVNREKPVLLLRGGETQAGAATAASHTGSMAGEQRVWRAFYRQTGLVHTRSIAEWMDAILAFTLLPAPAGGGVFIVGGGGGTSVVHGDICVGEGLHVPSLSAPSMAKLRPVVPVAGSIAGNPLDYWAIYSDPACLGAVLQIAYADPRVHMIIVDRMIPRKAFHMPLDMPDPTPGTIELMRTNGQRKPTVFLVDSDGGDVGLAEAGAAMRAQFCDAGVPAYPSFDRAARALAHLYRHQSHLTKTGAPS
jgi:acyl-CoA synthetase (NDP forming)